MALWDNVENIWGEVKQWHPLSLNCSLHALKRGNNYTLNPFKGQHVLSTCISHLHYCTFENEIDDGVPSISAP